MLTPPSSALSQTLSADPDSLDESVSTPATVPQTRPASPAREGVPLAVLMATMGRLVIKVRRNTETYSVN